ncbi:MAG: hypothetical protein J0H89_14100, partial [Rhizobiales bacterium]|nr:hypothetical protein [Hyphomicrobiales bacterium]
MYFSEKSIEDMRERFHSLPQRLDKLVAMYSNRQYRNDEARQFAIYGFIRRAQILRHTIEEVFDKLPPDCGSMPEIESRTAALVNLHAFTMSAFGAIDNLAWIWVKEKSIRYPDGTTIRMHHIGLGPKNTYIRGTFSAEFQQHLRSLKKWFKNLEGRRHPL